MAHGSMTMEKPKGKGGRKKLHHIRIHPVDGGHMVTHHAHSGEQYGPEHEEKPYKTHLFGEGEGAAMMEHVARHVKADLGDQEHEEAELERHEEEGESENG